MEDFQTIIHHELMIVIIQNLVDSAEKSQSI